MGVVGTWPAIGVFGGTFDPIHVGHLRTAHECRIRLGLAEVRFIPNSVPPHREPALASAATRLQMVEAAVAGIDGFTVDSRELDRDGPSYTIDTLRELRRDFPDATLCLILGLDAFLTLPSWREWRSLFDLAHLIIARRPGGQIALEQELRETVGQRVVQSVDALRARGSGCLLAIEVTQLDISSTALRASIAAGVSPAYLVPDAVWEVMRETGIYSEGSS